MKFIINEEKEEPKIKLRLEKSGDDVLLVGSDGSYEKTLMRFMQGKSGRVNCAELNGLETDEKGRIKEQYAL